MVCHQTTAAGPSSRDPARTQSLAVGESHVSSTSRLATASLHDKINCSYTELFPLLGAAQSITRCSLADLNQTPP